MQVRNLCPSRRSQWFQVLSDTVSYSYLVNDYWALELKPKYAFVNYADPALGIQWENLAEAEVSGSR